MINNKTTEQIPLCQSQHASVLVATPTAALHQQDCLTLCTNWPEWADNGQTQQSAVVQQKWSAYQRGALSNKSHRSARSKYVSVCVCSLNEESAGASWFHFSSGLITLYDPACCLDPWPRPRPLVAADRPSCLLSFALGCRSLISTKGSLSDSLAS